MARSGAVKSVHHSVPELEAKALQSLTGQLAEAAHGPVGLAAARMSPLLPDGLRTLLHDFRSGSAQALRISGLPVDVGRLPRTPVDAHSFVASDR
jgi:hypothetical protein